MKAISLHQPWASLIAVGVKTVETRTRKPPAGLMGQRIAIHAAKRPMKEAEYADFTDAMNEIGSATLDGQEFPLGAIVATARLADAWQVAYTSLDLDAPEVHPDGYPQVFGDADETCKADPYGDFSVGRWLWFLEDVEAVTPPVPEKGRQGFWEWRR